ncbi:sulfurtransferase [Alphaproteobacteria bacterium 46_93_T64]|nr:sulfurtransferase [Alphaproteobacteria bacterium 46_93_T64]
MQINVQQLNEMRQNGDDLLLLDVREPNELDICSIKGSLTIPMTQIPQRFDELPRDKTLVIMCHHGGRSMQVTQWLFQQGFDKAINLEGGIDHWAQLVDTTMPRY